MKRARLLSGFTGLALAIAGLSGCAVSRAQAPAAMPLYLVGQDWVGRWQDGAIAAAADMPGAAIQAVVPDGRGDVWVLSYPAKPANEADADRATLTRYAAIPLTTGEPVARGRFDRAGAGLAAIWPGTAPGRIMVVHTGADRAEAAEVAASSLAAGPWRAAPLDAVQPRIRAGRWLAPVPMLTGIDSDAVIDPARLIDAETFAPLTSAPAWLGGQLIAVSRDNALVMRAPGEIAVIALADGRLLGKHAVAAREPANLRAALSPDGGTAIVFSKPTGDGDAWPGTAWDVASGRTLPAAGLSIDSGTERELGQARSLACLLPGGKGAIFSLIGQPADRMSEAVLFDRDASRRVPLDTRVVQRCVIGGPAR